MYIERCSNDCKVFPEVMKKMMRREFQARELERIANS